MGVSRSTFQRSVRHAHRQVTLEVAEGLAPEIAGGRSEVIPPWRRGGRRGNTGGRTGSRGREGPRAARAGD